MAGSERVLVVEDDSDLCDLLGELLGASGFEPCCAYDGKGAMASIEAGRPDAIVLDVMLPDVSGFEICRKLKLHRETNLIPILMLTAMDDPESMRSGLRFGANRYLTKPFDPDQLVAEVRGAIRHARDLAARKTHTAVVFQMQSDQRPREQLNDVLSELFVQTPLTDEQVHQIRYAALEMIQNAVEWGNRYQKESLVTINYEVTDEAVKLIITDQGQGFDRENLPHAAGGEDPIGHMEIREKLGLRNGGFGIYVSRGMVDEFSYNEKGNQVTLVKRF